MSIMKPPFHTELNLGHRLSQGIVGCWLFNEAPPQLGSAMDLSGNGNHGRLFADAHSVPGPRGPVLEFDGTWDRVNITGVSTGSSWTIVTLINPLAAVNPKVFDSEAGRLVFEFAGLTEEWRIFDTSARDTGITDGFEGIWSHWAITQRNAKLNFYRNGNIVAENVTSAGNSIGGTCVIAARYSQDQTFFNGQIDHVIIYNRALNAGEIKELYRDPFQMFKRNL